MTFQLLVKTLSFLHHSKFHEKNLDKPACKECERKKCEKKKRRKTRKTRCNNKDHHECGSSDSTKSLSFVGSEVFILPLTSLQSLDLSLVSSQTSGTDTSKNSINSSKRHHPLHAKVALVQQYYRQLNAHNIQGTRRLLTEDFVMQFRSSDYELKRDELVHEEQKIFDAFSDYCFTYGRIEASSGKEFGETVVTVHNLTSGGTHTAKAYGFGPYEAIEPQGTFALNDPQTIIFHFDENDKISKAEVFSEGELTGPAGVYAQLGGFPIL